MLLKTTKFFLYASVFSVVIVMPSTFFPFIGGKYYFFRLCVEITAAAFLLWWAFEARPRLLMEKLKKVIKEPLFIAVSVFVLAYLLASLFAHSPSAAFWSNFERGEGGFQMIHYYSFFLLLLLAFDSKQDWKKLFISSVSAAVLVVLYGIFANLGWMDSFISTYAGGKVPEEAWQKLTAGRFFGSLGNPAYLGPYLMFAIFFASRLFADSKEKIIKYGLIILSAFFLFFFYLSRTRGALIGLALALLFVFAYSSIKTKGKTRKISLSLLALSLLSGAFVLWVSFSLVPACKTNSCEGISKALVGNRLLNFSFSEDTLNTRLWTWESAWEGFKDRPIFGWGQENFSTVFDKYFDTRHYASGQSSETWFDRAHSVVFDYLAETGLVGFLSYLSVFIIFFWQLFSRLKDNSRFIFEKATISAILIAYFAQGLALFDVLPIYIPLFITFAFGVYLLSEKQSKAPQAPQVPQEAQVAFSPHD